MIYRICPSCGCNLDPGEICDCQRTKKEAAPLQRRRPQDQKTTDILSFRIDSVKRERGSGAWKT